MTWGGRVVCSSRKEVDPEKKPGAYDLGQA